MIRAKDPKRVWRKSQTPAFRLAEQRIETARQRRKRASSYAARTHNTLLRRVERFNITPLMPGERHA